MARHIFEIYYDDMQEGLWFKSLNQSFTNAALHPITGASSANRVLAPVLQYDRPDIVLTDSGRPILIVERTVEVPSGHNVGQRFARLAAAAQAKVPLVYFGPYAAYKHGGVTQGPRYMNLRLFYALDAMATTEGTAVTTIKWPVDGDYEIVQGPSKDIRMVEYLRLFLSLYSQGGVAGVNTGMKDTEFHAQQIAEREEFIAAEVEDPQQYEVPPDSVTIEPTPSIQQIKGYLPCEALHLQETVLYHVGMRYIRSDPYTGMGMLYEYLYAGGASHHNRNMVFWFPHITRRMWEAAARSGRARKDIRLYRQVADAVLFADGLVPKAEL